MGYGRGRVRIVSDEHSRYINDITETHVLHTAPLYP